MKFSKTNIYLDQGTWCHATWIDGDYDCSGELGISDDASEEEAIAAAESLLSNCVHREVVRVDDI